MEVTHEPVTKSVPAHEMWELQQMQGLPLDIKIRKTELRIQEWYEHWEGNVYVSFSGGVDSEALGHMVRRLYPDVPFVYVDTGLEYPELRAFVKTFENVEILKPAMPFKKVVKKYGYPVVSKTVCETVQKLRHNNLSEKYRHYKMYGDERGKMGTLAAKWHILLDAPFEVSPKCCDVMKKRPFHLYEKKTERKPFIGTLADDSKARMRTYLQNGCNAFDGKAKSTPLGFWKRTDVLEYIYRNNLPVCEVYGEIVKKRDGTYDTTGVKHTGCMFCCFGVHMEGHPNRFQQMAKTHPKHYTFCMNTLGFASVLDYIGVDYQPASTLDWWAREGGT